jgi:hypothetical protein
MKRQRLYVLTPAIFEGSDEVAEEEAVEAAEAVEI